MRAKKLFLAQSDTTAGFLSQDFKKLSDAKKRDPNQPFLICVDSYKKLKHLTRVPKIHKKYIRRVDKASFLYNNKKAIRVVKESHHAKLLKEFDFLYSTSANIHKEKFDLNYAKSCAEIIIEDSRAFYETDASKIFKLGKKKLHKLR